MRHANDHVRDLGRERLLPSFLASRSTLARAFNSFTRSKEKRETARSLVITGRSMYILKGWLFFCEFKTATTTKTNLMLTQGEPPSTFFGETYLSSSYTNNVITTQTFGNFLYLLRHFISTSKIFKFLKKKQDISQVETPPLDVTQPHSVSRSASNHCKKEWTKPVTTSRSVFVSRRRLTWAFILKLSSHYIRVRLYRIALTPAREPYRIGLLFTYTLL